MESVNLSPANRARLETQKAAQKSYAVTKPNQPTKESKDKLKLALTCLGVAGCAIAAGVMIYRHKNPNDVVKKASGTVHNTTNSAASQSAKATSAAKPAAKPVINPAPVQPKPAAQVQSAVQSTVQSTTQTPAKVIKSLDEVDFATIKKDKFSGIVQGTLKDGTGDKITMEYVDGAIKSSKREGVKSFEKIYETLPDGTHKVTKTLDGTTTSCILEDLQSQAQKSQAELKEILAKKDELSLDEFKKRTDAIKHKSASQKDEIEQIISDKQSKATQAQKAAKAAQIAQKEQELFVREQQTAEKFVTEHLEELDSILLDSEGKISYSLGAGTSSGTFEEIFRPYEGNLGTIYHGTTPEAKTSILKDGFNPLIRPKHGYLDGIGGTYFALESPDNYGSAVISARFKGRVAQADTDILNHIKTNFSHRFDVEELAQKHGLKVEGETVMQKYMQAKLRQMGFQGVIGSNISYNAGGIRYFSTIDPKLIEIIS